MRRASVAALILASLALFAWLIVRGRARVPDAGERVVRSAERTAAEPVGPPLQPDSGVAVFEAAVTLEAESSDATLDHPESNATGTSMPDVLLDPRLFIDKSARTLALLSDGSIIKTYRVALGSSPHGDKKREGDGRTPEGTFYVCTKNPKSRHTRALGLSYPSLQHAEEGLEEGLITKRQFRTIAEALRRYERPPWTTPLGGEIMIHGGGVETDWTQGCIALDDTDATELFDALPMGTPVQIVR